MALNLSSLLQTITGTASSLLGGVQTYLIVAAVSGVLAASGGIWLGYHIEYGRLEAQLAADSLAQAKAVAAMDKSDQAQERIDVDAAMDWQAQYDHDNLTPTVVTKEITRYVTLKADAVSCIPVGLARVMRAAADHEADPATLVAPAGQSDDACSDLPASEMARWFEGFAGAAFTNADHVNALEKWIDENHAAQVSASK